MPEEEKEELILQCPRCGCGDVRWCHISHRPYCGDCRYWGPVNFGSDQDAIKAWNKRLKAFGYEPEQKKSVDNNLDYILDFIDYMMKSGQFLALDQMLLRLDIDKMHEAEALAFLTFTLPVKNKMLLGRVVLFNRLKKRYPNDPDMLKGLE